MDDMNPTSACPHTGVLLKVSPQRRLGARVPPLAFYILTLIALPACMPAIWNAGDLANWVRDQAVDRGCERDTVVLEEWYVETSQGNVWRGTCIGGDQQPMEFGVNVDSVWTPSGE